MKALRRILQPFLALTVAAGVLAFAEPAAAIPSRCADWGYANGRSVTTHNDGNGGGSYVYAVMCWTALGNGYYNTHSYYFVRDTEANGAGATPLFVFTGTDGRGYDMYPPENQRAWTYNATNEHEMTINNIKGLYVRACLTNGDRPAHTCGPKA